ncbi:hypothetical protein KAJ83_09805 [Marivibrio halodurans]|uniref:Uncharacterized protein n=2 Tax=Marivibrio halodurans TaxID=2039722 RepID=A0A8J7SIV2_9PROT|nr:hypothetical protein [Marivibrio halodurans]MBP5857303.1 hypothetical protein [Marivibrio halodurans]
MARYRSRFDVRDRVTIDGDASIAATVVAVTFCAGRAPIYRVEWMVNGSLESVSLDEFRLEKVGA